jgi:hypothetical protein
LQTHIFWSGRWRNPSHGIVTDAWLATQPLKDGHRLRWWYEGEGPDAAFLERYTSPSSPYSQYVEVAEFNEAKESAGTCLEGMREWTDLEYAKSLEMPIQTKSDLVRTLLLKNYGGIWLDSAYHFPLVLPFCCELTLPFSLPFPPFSRYDPSSRLHPSHSHRS